MEVFFHSDDFGVELSQSESIRKCRTNGALNSISLMATSPNAAECYELIRNDVGKGRIYPIVHLNFIEGPALLSAEQIPDLVDGRGFFKASFVSLLAAGFGGKKRRDRIRSQLVCEIRAQIRRFLEIVEDPSVRWGIDGHQHLHMIPLVWDALCEVIESDGLKPDRIRRSVDPVGPVLLTPAVWKKIRPVNIIKWMLLALISPSRRKMLTVCRRVPVFFGMFFTCRMEEDVVKKLFVKYRRISARLGRDLELMFHPGYLKDRSKTLDPRQGDLYEMICSDFRIKEQKTLISLKEERWRK